MTPLPKRRWSTRRQGKRRASFVSPTLAMVKCDHCGELKQNHTACPKCGFYKGKLVLTIKNKKSKNKKQS
ncbi:50S ribosomal protein L32 [Candidatus Shapirobacteria bacterium CG03_land_8_20_14_0_80_39_12]|uniref:Large ribosomal subunit protein bL32 n=1 Tax=Candidatus Shapirobacteria bacterium CG03_land_8_20_14_0_80_39_12 TaxID=1974879 RepID=A0A2M7BBH2_9BACT|nr:MAG: 50S ribosomal protein L32 [Candidatus Shapirobacteria bacterium CG03_land_8_20_14_0_80_39_12]